MLSAEGFALAHLAIVIGGLMAFAVLDRRSRGSYHGWHRAVRYQRLSTEAMLKRLNKNRR